MKKSETMVKVLFVCVGNSCRSQMAEAFFNELSQDGVAESAGTMPAKEVDRMAIEVMREVGIDISKNKPRALTPAMNLTFDVIVTMGCTDGCPLTPKEKTIEWHIDDPKGKDIDFYRAVRDRIRIKIEKLIDELTTQHRMEQL